ncbi:hypothetical protein O71_16300 [Pontibacter sp. BAB1700]|nr:hypothetical protein O71_16300 [Pontibacter sp. BAB1700]
MLYLLGKSEQCLSSHVKTGVPIGKDRENERQKEKYQRAVAQPRKENGQTTVASFCAAHTITLRLHRGW